MALCENWRSMDRRGDYNDVYDGQIWKDFQTVHGTNFLAQSHNFAVVLNMDFFQLYKHIKGYLLFCGSNLWCVDEPSARNALQTRKCHFDWTYSRTKRA